MIISAVDDVIVAFAIVLIVIPAKVVVPVVVRLILRIKPDVIVVGNVNVKLPIVIIILFGMSIMVVEELTV